MKQAIRKTITGDMLATDDERKKRALVCAEHVGWGGWGPTGSGADRYTVARSRPQYGYCPSAALNR